MIIFLLSSRGQHRGSSESTMYGTVNSLFVFCLKDPENTEAADLQRKLEMLNNIMDQEARAEQARRQILYIGHCEY